MNEPNRPQDWIEDLKTEVSGMAKGVAPVWRARKPATEVCVGTRAPASCQPRSTPNERRSVPVASG